MNLADSYVLDCSLTMAWFFEDEATPATDAIFAALPESEVHVPALWPMEIANVMTLAERKRRTTEAKISHFVKTLLEQPIYIDYESPDRSFTHLMPLAKRHGLTIYDAAYLELALRRDLPLATLDHLLLSAAKAEGVPAI